MRKYLGLFAALILGVASQQALAANDNIGPNDNSNESCVDRTGMPFDTEFGGNAGEITRCIERRHQVKVMFQLNQAWTCTTPGLLDADHCKAYGLGNIGNLITDYEQSYGMVAGKDFDVVVVVHGHGWPLMFKDTHQNASDVTVTNTNPFQSDVEALMARGVKFYLCQNSVRHHMGMDQKTGEMKELPVGNVTAQLIPGVHYTTSGVAALADFQALGYTYIQP